MAKTQLNFNPQTKISYIEDWGAFPSSPNSGDYVFVTDTGLPDGEIQKYYIRDTHQWLDLRNNTNYAEYWDIKQSLLTEDYNGWILLDGRAISTLTATQQVIANAIFSGNLPDATNAYLAQGGTLGAITGANTKTITQANLPNYTLPTATTSSDSHNHTGTTSTNSHNHTYSHATNYVRYGGDGGTVPNNNATTTTSTNSHNHTFTTSTDAHTHTVAVNSGGSNTPLDITPKTLSVNTFVYLWL